MHVNPGAGKTTQLPLLHVHVNANPGKTTLLSSWSKLASIIVYSTIVTIAYVHVDTGTCKNTAVKIVCVYVNPDPDKATLPSQYCLCACESWYW